MTGKTEDYPYPLARMDHPTQLKPDGLLVRYPGIILYSLDFMKMLGTNCGNTSFDFPIDRELNEWFSVTPIVEGELKDIVISLQIESKVEKMPKRFSLIMPRPRPKERKEVAVLVEIHTTHWRRREGHSPHEVHKCRIITRVWVSRTEPKGFGHFGVIGELTDENQHWCVDDYESNISRTASPEVSEGTDGDGASVGTSFLKSFNWRLPRVWPSNSDQRGVNPNDKSEPGLVKSHTFHTVTGAQQLNPEEEEPRPGQLARARANTSFGTNTVKRQ